MAKKVAGKKEAKATVKPVKKVTSKKEGKAYVQYETIKKSVGAGLNYPGEMKVCPVGRHKVVVQRQERLDRYGNPVHTAALLKKDGSLGPTHTSNGAASKIVSRALGKSGVATKYGKSKKRGK